MPRDKDRGKGRGKEGRGGRRDRDEGKGGFGRKQKRKVCQFCKEEQSGVKAYVDYKDTQMLRKFVSDRGKIRARRVTGTCAQHQADVAKAVKNAREMGLVPYAVR